MHPRDAPRRPRNTRAEPTAARWLARARRAPNCAVAIRDHYHFWKSRNEFPRAGKLLLDDPEDTGVLQMFFDDNIGHAGAHIVDARDVRTGMSLPFRLVQHAQLNRAEPVNSILDDKAFVRCAARSVSLRNDLEKNR